MSVTKQQALANSLEYSWMHHATGKSRFLRLAQYWSNQADILIDIPKVVVKKMVEHNNNRYAGYKNKPYRPGFIVEGLWDRTRWGFTFKLPTGDEVYAEAIYSKSLNDWIGTFDGKAEARKRMFEYIDELNTLHEPLTVEPITIPKFLPMRESTEWFPTNKAWGK